MKKETTKKQKNLYIILLICTVAVIITAVTLSLVFGLRGETPLPPDDPGIGGPVDPVDPGAPIDPVDPVDPGGPVDPVDPGDPVDTDPEIFYEMPLTSYTLGQSFSIDTLVWSNTLKWFQTHNGTDFLAEKGTPVRSVYSGTVGSVGYSNLDGYYVVINLDSGVTAVYKSLTADITVSEGDTVRAGAVIGAVGDSMASEQNEGPHLHLEMTQNGAYLDPMAMLMPEDK